MAGLGKATIAYYVTGHGLGHATRSIFTIQYLLNSSHYVHIISSISSSFFSDNLKDPSRRDISSTSSSSISPCYSIHQRTLDSGAIQKGPLCIDGYETLERYYSNILQNYSQLLLQEIQFLQNNNIQILITDATSLVCKAGYEVGCKVIILSNFTWDIMYSGMLNEIMNTLDENTIRKYNEMIQQISNDYCYANIYLQLPGAVSLPSHMTSSTQHISGPLICRNSLRSRDEILQQYSLNSLQFEHILLIGFGGHDVPWDIFHNPLNLPIPENWICLILGGTEASSSSSSTSSSPSSSRILSIPYQCYVPDLISISSVVLGKLGYGFMSECLSHDVPLLYITRSCWPEEDYLRDYMTNYQINDQDKSKINCLEMNYDDFIGGNWEKYLQKCLQGRKVWNGDVIEETRRMELRQRQQLERLDEIYQVICSLETK